MSWIGFGLAATGGVIGTAFGWFPPANNFGRGLVHLGVNNMGAGEPNSKI